LLGVPYLLIPYLLIPYVLNRLVRRFALHGTQVPQTALRVQPGAFSLLVVSNRIPINGAGSLHEYVDLAGAQLAKQLPRHDGTDAVGYQKLSFSLSDHETAWVVIPIHASEATSFGPAFKAGHERSSDEICDVIPPLNPPSTIDPSTIYIRGLDQTISGAGQVRNGTHAYTPRMAWMSV